MSSKGRFHDVEALCKRHQGIPARKEKVPMDKRKDIEVVTRKSARNGKFQTTVKLNGGPTAPAVAPSRCGR